MRPSKIAWILVVVSLCSSCLAQVPAADEPMTCTQPTENTVQATPMPMRYWQLQNKAPLFIAIQKLETSRLISVNQARKLQTSDKIAVSGSNIWMVAMAEGGFSFGNYNIVTNLTTNYTVSIGSGYGSPTDLLLAKNGSLWALGSVVIGPDKTFIDTYEKEPRRFPHWQLQRYEVSTDRLMPIQDLDRLLFGVFSGVESEGSGICEDNEGRLWMVIDAQLVVYDPVSNKAKRFKPSIVPIDDADNTIGTIQCDAKGHLWVVVNSIAQNGRHTWSLYKLEASPFLQA
jgi:hypothetical protein